MHLSRADAERIVNAANQSRERDASARGTGTTSEILPRAASVRGPRTNKRVRLWVAFLLDVTMFGTVPYLLEAPAWLSAGALLPGVGIVYSTPTPPGWSGLWALLPLSALVMLLVALRPGGVIGAAGRARVGIRVGGLLVAAAGVTASLMVPPPPGWDGAWILQPLAALASLLALTWAMTRIVQRGDYVSVAAVAVASMVLAGVLGAIHAGHGPGHAPLGWVPPTQVVLVLALIGGVYLGVKLRDRAARVEGDRREALLVRAARQDPPPSATARSEGAR